MTTAHRPTWAPAKGGEEQGGSRWFVSTRQASAKNQPGHLNLKYRQDGQGSSADLGARDLRAELLLKERQAAAKRKPGHVADFDEERRKDLLLLEGAGGGEPGKGGGGPGGGGGGGGARSQLVPKALDADDEDPDKDDSDSDDDDDDDDDEEALMAELERIKKERAEEAAKKAKAEAEAQTKERAEEVARGNPLLALAGGEPSFSIKRRWDNDVVFKNQTRGEPKAQKRFINDTIRNDFHKRFLHRYVR